MVLINNYFNITFLNTLYVFFPICIGCAYLKKTTPLINNEVVLNS